MVQDRRVNPQEAHIPAISLRKGLDKILKKVGEECSETLIAAKNGIQEETVGEISDLLYHLTVLMVEQDTSPLRQLWTSWTAEVKNRQSENLPSERP